MSAFKETTSPEKNREIDRPIMRETDAPRLSPNIDFKDNPFSDSSDVFDAAFKNFGLTADTSEKKSSDTKDSAEDKDYSDYLEKGDDGKYYDKETGKAYDSIEAWEKAQETLAKRYEGTAKYYEEKAKKEWARFKNAEKNGESDAEKWEHYRRSQEYYAKAKECKEKAEKTWAKLGKTSDTSSENNQSSPEKEYQDASERREYSGRELLYEARTSAESLAQKADSREDAERVKTLCEEIAYNSDRDDEVEANGGLLPEYQRLMDEGDYDSIEEMCNAEGLNYDEIYDDEPSTYGDEYQRGFVDCIDKNKSPYTTSEDECTDAYYQGLLDAQELLDLLA